MPDLFAYGGPRDATRTLAATSDVQLAEDIRDALIAVALCGDAWLATLSHSPERYDCQRADLLGAVRHELILAGSAGTVDQLAALAAPILNPYWPTSHGPAASLAEAVEVLRHVVMHRLPAVRAARTEIERWDANHG